VDVEGCVWSAHWNGWKVVRYSPFGEPIFEVEVPAQQVTSCCFGGKGLDKLFITSARIDLPDKDLKQQPHAGDVFMFETDTQGLPTNYYGKAP